MTDKVPSILAIQGCRFVPKNMFGNDPPQMVTLVPNNLNIGFQGPWRLKIQGQNLQACNFVKVFFLVDSGHIFHQKICRFFRRQQQRQGLGSQDSGNDQRHKRQFLPSERSLLESPEFQKPQTNPRMDAEMVDHRMA